MHLTTGSYREIRFAGSRVASLVALPMVNAFHTSGGDCMEISKQNKIGSALLSIRSGRKMAFGRDDGVILNNISGSHIFFSCTKKSGIPQPWDEFCGCSHVPMMTGGLLRGWEGSRTR